MTFASCADYEEGIEVIDVNIRLVFPKTYDGPHDGLRVELRNGVASTFVDSTDTAGIAHFSVPSGLYTASSSAEKRTYDYRYFFNGTKSQIVIAQDSSRVVDLPLTMTRRRIVH